MQNAFGATEIPDAASFEIYLIKEFERLMRISANRKNGVWLAKGFMRWQLVRMERWPVHG